MLNYFILSGTHLIIILLILSLRDETNFVELEDSFRAGLLKINISDTITQTILPPSQSFCHLSYKVISMILLFFVDTSFLIHLHTNKQAAASLYHDQEVQVITCISYKTQSITINNTLRVT